MMTKVIARVTEIISVNSETQYKEKKEVNKMAKTPKVGLFDTPLVKIRMYLMNKLPFFGVLIHKLEPVEKSEEWFTSLGAKGSVMATDGRKIYYDPVNFNKLSEKEQCFIVAHEIMHNAYGHFARLGKRDRLIANCAQDYVINLALVDDGKENPSIEWQAPTGVLLDEQYRGMNWEMVYDLLMQDGGKKMRDKLSGGKGKLIGWCMPGGSGGEKSEDEKGEKGEGSEGSDGGEMSQDQLEGLAEAWKIASEQAALNAQNAGSTSAGMDRLLVDIRQAKHDWKQQIRDYFTVQGNYTWAKPSRRYIGSGMYLPSLTKSRLGHIVFVIDASGSIDKVRLEEVASEMASAMDACGEWPERVTVMYHDSVVTRVEEQEGELRLTPNGGGGTCFQPVFDYVKHEDWTPQVMFYFTDLMSSDVPVKPEGYPVVWLVEEQFKNGFNRMGFGELVVLAKE